VDVTNPEQVQALARFAVQSFGQVDIWVNNAGAETPYGPTMSYTPEDFTLVVQTTSWASIMDRARRWRFSCRRNRAS
jgi:NAD(P)-dependent dehydrogenase (short-subunit alcohol dehydrogenase family)